MNLTEECRIKKVIEELDKRISALENKSKNKNPLDLNNDGKVDKEDASIAGKVMADRRKKLK